MSHLTPEELARLLDEAPTAQEAAHLAACSACRTELEQMREDVQSLSMLPDVAPAPDAWAALERRLTDEGLIRRRGIRFGSFGAAGMMQIAAALLLFAGGTVTGRMMAQPVVPDIALQPTTSAPDALRPDVQPQPAPETARLASTDTGVDGVGDVLPPATGAQPRRPSNMTLASSGFGGAQAVTLDEAVDVLRQAEELYLAALTRYAELATQSESGDPVARLAALQTIVMTTQAALNQTPMDPVINGYHLTALAQRDATLRQVAAATGDRAW